MSKNRRLPKRKNAALQDALAAAGLFPQDVADATGLCVETVRNYINREQVPTRDNAEKIARLLAVPVTDLFDAFYVRKPRQSE